MNSQYFGKSGHFSWMLLTNKACVKVHWKSECKVLAGGGGGGLNSVLNCNYLWHCFKQYYLFSILLSLNNYSWYKNSVRNQKTFRLFSSKAPCINYGSKLYIVLIFSFSCPSGKGKPFQMCSLPSAFLGRPDC